MPPHIEQAIERVLDRLRRLGLPVVDLIQPGRPIKHIREAFAGVGLVAPDDLLALYAYRDGTKVAKGDLLDDLHLFPGFYWLSLKDAFNSYKAFYQDPRWNRDWFPVFGNGGGDFYAAMCNKSSAGHGSIVGFRLGETDHAVEFKDLPTTLGWIDRCYVDGVFFLKNGYLESNDRAAILVAKELNPGLPYYGDGYKH